MDLARRASAAPVHAVRYSRATAPARKGSRTHVQTRWRSAGRIAPQVEVRTLVVATGANFVRPHRALRVDASAERENAALVAWQVAHADENVNLRLVAGLHIGWAE